MKHRLSIGVCILISAVLVAFGLIYGTVSGFNEDRRQVTDLLNGTDGLMDMLSYRGADGFNLCVVAQRHLTNDSDVQTLSRVAGELTAENSDLTRKKEANAELEEAVKAVVAKLEAQPSYQQSQRDQRYVSMLESDLQNLSQSALSTTYNDAAQEFNQRLDSSLLGSLAKLLGTKPCELYE